MGPALIIWILAGGLLVPGIWLWRRLAKAGCRGPSGILNENKKPASAVRLSIIIPARNEEQNLPVLLDSIASQSRRPDEVIVVDDGSTDRTAEVSREWGARVIRSESLPEGWRGKTWACHQGAMAAEGDLLLFVDADTWFEPGGLSRILSAYRGGAFSVGPHHVIREPYENLSLFFNLNMVLGTLPSGLFGQMLLVNRENYRQAGGHEVVKGRILENFWLSDHFRSMKIPTRSQSGRGVFSFRMYPGGVSDLVQGWTKGFASGAGRTSRRTLALVVVWMIGLMFAPLGAWFNGDWGPWGTIYGVAAIQVWGCARQVGTFHWLSALFYPIPLLFFFVVFARAVRCSGRSVQWKGREIRAD